MKKYKAPYMDMLELKMTDILMSSNGITTNESVFGFGVDVDGGDEIW